MATVKNQPSRIQKLKERLLRSKALFHILIFIDKIQQSDWISIDVLLSVVDRFNILLYLYIL